MKIANRCAAFVAVCACFAIAACSDDAPSAGPANGVVFIFHSNDMHGTLEGFQKIAWLVRQYRATNDNVLVVSGGDAFSGNSYVDQYDPKGYPMLDVMSRVGYSVSAIGNHEFDYTQPVLNDRIAQTPIKFVSANIAVTSGALLPPAATYTTNMPCGARITFLGLTEKNYSGIPSTHPDKVVGLTFADPVTAAMEYSTLAAGTSRAVIALTHIGASVDTSLAAACGWLDVIIGGHSHSTIGNSTGSTGTPMIVQAGSSLTQIGIVRLRFSAGTLVEKSQSLVAVSGIAGEDATLNALIDTYQSNPALEVTVATLTGALYDSTMIGWFLTDGTRSVTGAHMSFQNMGGVRVYSIPAGNLTKKQIFEADPFGNDLYTYKMTLDQLNAFFATRSDLYASGIKRSGSSWTFYDGTALTNGTYTVAMSSYIASTTVFSCQSGPFYTGMNTAEAVIKYATDAGTLGLPTR